MALSDASNILWKERQLAELLVFKLEEEQLIFAARRNRWIPRAQREVESVIGEIRRVELEWAVHVADAGRELGFSDTPTLRDLATLTPAPWAGIFADHRRALLALAREIDQITKSTRDLSQRGHATAHETLGEQSEIDIDQYDANGALDGQAVLPDRSVVLRIVDEPI